MVWAFISNLSIVQKAIAIALALALIVSCALWFKSWLFGDIETQRDIAEGQSGAAIASGTDAVNSVGKNEADTDERERKIEDAQRDVNDAVDGNDADGIGLDRLCSLFGVCDES